MSRVVIKPKVFPKINGSFEMDTKDIWINSETTLEAHIQALRDTIDDLRKENSERYKELKRLEQDLNLLEDRFLDDY